MSIPTKKITVDAWAEEFSKYISEESFKMLIVGARAKGPQALDKVLSKFIARIIGMTIYDALKNAPNGAANQEEAYERSLKEFKSTKIRMQEAVALGFQSALKSYSNRDIEYYCSIAPVPEPLSKSIN